MYFSFIIPCYNEEEDIANTIEACINQDYHGEYEILLIYNESKDNTLQIINNYSILYERVKVLTYDGNKSVSFARNYGIKNSLGNVIIFLNADEIPQKDFLHNIEKFFSKGADYLFPQTEVLNKDTAYGIYREAYRKYKYSSPNSFLWSQGFSCRKNILEQIGGFDTCYPGCGGEDWDLVTKIEKLSLNRVVDLSTVVKHKVPQGLGQAIWHMYNRGRGSAYFDLIQRKKSSHIIIFKLLLNTSFLLFILLDKTFLLFILIYWAYYHLICSYNRAKKVNSLDRIHQVAIIGFFDRIIRFIGYYHTIFKSINK